MSLNREDNPSFGEQLKNLFEKWKPLEKNGSKVLIWNYDRRENIVVIYRFVIASDDDVFTIYVGSGDNLSGKGGSTSLVHQYQHGNRVRTMRPKLEDEINAFKNKGYSAWTEIIELSEKLKDERDIIENLGIYRYWFEYIENLGKKTEVPRFLNGKIEKLYKIANWVKPLGFVE